LAHFYGTWRRSYLLHPLALARSLFWDYGLRPLGGLAIHRLMPDARKRSRLKRLLGADPAWVAPEWELRAEQRRRAEGTQTPYEPPQGFYVREICTSLDHTLSSWELEEHYQQGKQIGVRFFHPFWDPDVVDVCCRTPIRLVNQGGRSKGLVRQMLAR